MQLDVRVKGKKKFHIQGILGKQQIAGSIVLGRMTWSKTLRFGMVSRCTKSFKPQSTHAGIALKDLYPCGEKYSVLGKSISMDILCSPSPFTGASVKSI